MILGNIMICLVFQKSMIYENDYNGYKVMNIVILSPKMCRKEGVFLIIWSLIMIVAFECKISDY